MRVLVAAASKHGGTAEMAGWIGRTLSESGIDAVVMATEDVGGLDGFDAVVLGSAVYAGHWLDSGRRLAMGLAPRLAERPVWLFSSGPVGDPPRPDGEPNGIDDLVEATGAREHRVFGGRIERGDLGVMERVMVSALHVPDRDDRHRDEVIDWARTIAADVSARSRDGALAPSLA